MSGLAAAYQLVTAATPSRVVLLEGSTRLGGCVRGAELAGVRVDLGPESLLARVPWGVALLKQLGLQAEMTSPAPIGAHLWLRGALRPLPAGLMTGEARARAIRQAGLLTWRGQLRASMDLVMPGKAPSGDESVADAIGSRLGSEAVLAIAEPLLGGVYAGDVERLSTQAAMPFLAAARQRGGSLLRALRTGATASDGPVFVSLRGGLAQLPVVVGDKLAEAGADVRLNTPASAIVRRDEGLEITLGDGGKLAADAAVLALPAPQAAKLLADSAPVAAHHLDQIEHAQVAIASFALAPDTRLPASSGFLVARAEGLTISACTLTSQKWPRADLGGPVLVRCSVGRAGSPAPSRDDDLLRSVRADLATTLGINSEPLDTRVERFDQALPQHEVGHLERLQAIEGDVARAFPQVSLAGAWTRGIGIAACIRDGRKAAEVATTAARSAAEIGA